MGTVYDPTGSVAAQRIMNDYSQYCSQNANQQLDAQQRAQLLQAYQQQMESKRMDGSKPIVVCNGVTENCDDLEKANRRAEELAHKHGCNAYILKPITMVAPKRDVVVTTLS